MLAPRAPGLDQGSVVPGTAQLLGRLQFKHKMRPKRCVVYVGVGARRCTNNRERTNFSQAANLSWYIV